jgi:hypothetical protein
LLPTWTFPKLTLEGFGDKVPCVPAPLKAIVSGEPGALLVIETLPLALPEVVGANFAVNEIFPPALMVTGTVKPLMLNPVPEALAAEIVMLAVPGFVNVIDWDPLLPTWTFPKATLDGFGERVPCVPVPLKAIVAGDPGALLVIEMLPVALPEVVGANCAVNEVFAPALIVVGKARPLILKPAPEALAAEIVSAALPGLVNVTLCAELPPTLTFPKATLTGLIVS